MTITILVLTYILFIADVIDVIKKDISNIAISGALVTLLSWQISIPWGIVMCCVLAILIIKAILKN